MVDVFVVDNDFGMATLNKLLLELLDAAGVLDSIDFCSWHHTVAHLCLREVKGILKEANLLLNVVLILSIVNATLY